MEVGYTDKVGRTQASEFLFFGEELGQRSRWFRLAGFLFRGCVLYKLVVGRSHFQLGLVFGLYFGIALVFNDVRLF